MKISYLTDKRGTDVRDAAIFACMLKLILKYDIRLLMRKPVTTTGGPVPHASHR